MQQPNNTTIQKDEDKKPTPITSPLQASINNLLANQQQKDVSASSSDSDEGDNKQTDDFADFPDPTR